ncbi:MAG: hypothetical protein BGO67_02660 [Alphaproteobacteria bacterium 41-28]|nr:MAG: hypothetical protein BGO67_02660 [Alphaproteobacteria bacterium 41-28]
MRTDAEIIKNVKYILENDPGLDATHILVDVKNGIVTLTGTVHSSTAKWMAKEAVKHVSGVREIIEELQIAPVL